jgi:putative SOS response-associated peptidase YedK
MCGRYTLRVSGKELQRELGLAEEPVLEARYNLAPTQAPIVTQADPAHVTVARWGLIPHWAKDAQIAAKMINARAETLASKGAFHEALQRRRCLVPADGFYEWKRQGRTKQPMHVGLPAGGLVTFAGLWDLWRAPNGLDVVTFTIVTTAANPQLSTLHDRMPAFLGPKARALWLDPKVPEEALLQLLEPWRGEALRVYPVSSLVGSVEVDDPRCVEPAQQVQLDLL